LFVSAAVTEDDLREAALRDEKVMAATTGKDVAKVIVIPRKLVNIVVK